MARLSDVDALIRSICNRCNDVNYDEPCEPSDCAFYYAVHDAPTVDAVPVVHGRWVWCKEGWWQCSECACCPADWEPDHDNEYGLPPYCHCCGSKMDLDQKI